ncbi:MAG TPA: triose-phosphate isomerase [Deltaproteobacteria bacterium]|nr:MAG: triose-phosphate isomerase [Deltaproteobacteria bacterium GWA2_45_12]HBF12006.1 triose-phosphate isomerase [Deltaproteobacteria bacterium]
MRTLLIVANWKMNHTIEDSIKFITHLKKALLLGKKSDIVLCPSFTSLYPLAMALQESETPFIKLGAQNCHYENTGAYTGEISPVFLKEVECSYVLVGHSERRHIFGETDEWIGKKVSSVLKHDMNPILCVGETLLEHEKNKTMSIITHQLTKGLELVSKEEAVHLTIAYEPVWAIGTGHNASPEQAEEVHAQIRGWLETRFDKTVAANIRILYGGSVKSDNAKDLTKQPNIDGLLVGGASLTVDSFSQIVNDS